MYISLSCKRLFVSAVVMAALGFGMSEAANAAEPITGGYIGDAASEGAYKNSASGVLSVKQVKLCEDDAHVVLKGRITQSLGDEHYMFADESGSIEVEIDHEVWNNQSVKPEDLVILEGEVDKDFNRFEVEVKRVIKQ